MLERSPIPIDKTNQKTDFLHTYAQEFQRITGRLAKRVVLTLDKNETNTSNNKKSESIFTSNKLSRRNSSP
jgi:hypothetical protein